MKGTAGGAMAFWDATPTAQPTDQEEVYREVIRTLSLGTARRSANS